MHFIFDPNILRTRWCRLETKPCKLASSSPVTAYDLASDMVFDFASDLVSDLNFDLASDSASNVDSAVISALTFNSDLS